MFNPPIAWIMTAAEILLGNYMVSIGYPVLGGIIIGLAVGSFLTRANMPYHIRRLLKKIESV